jgi:two-component system nitrogen regulation sensor histidine kinase GlnL
LRKAIEGDASLRAYTDIMIREVDRVNQLIEQLLDLSRPWQLNFAPVNIHEILDKCWCWKRTALRIKRSP